MCVPKPSSVTAACLCLASRDAELSILQADIATVAGTRPVILQKCFTEPENELVLRSRFSVGWIVG